MLPDDEGRITRIRTPVLGLEAHMTPTHLCYMVQHFAVPEPMRAEDWRVSIDGAVKQPVSLSFEDIRRLPARTVRTAMECSGARISVPSSRPTSPLCSGWGRERLYPRLSPLLPRP